jgi:hypothetical protein
LVLHKTPFISSTGNYVSRVFVLETETARKIDEAMQIKGRKEVYKK